MSVQHTLKKLARRIGPFEFAVALGKASGLKGLSSRDWPEAQGSGLSYSD
jgi:hypothetical protein